MNLSRYLSFTRNEWAPLRGKTPLTLGESDLQALRGLNERLDLDEVRASSRGVRKVRMFFW